MVDLMRGQLAMWERGEVVHSVRTRLALWGRGGVVLLARWPTQVKPDFRTVMGPQRGIAARR